MNLPLPDNYSLIYLAGPWAKKNLDQSPVLDKQSGLPLYTYRVSLSDGQTAVSTTLTVPDSSLFVVHDRMNAEGLSLTFYEFPDSNGKTQKGWVLKAEGLGDNA